MRPVRFVALSEDGQAFVLADEVGRLLALPIDERITGAMRPERASGATATLTAPAAPDAAPSLSPRDIQARIRSGDSAEEVARVAGVPVDRVLRYAGPVLQERAMLAQHARRTKLRTSAKGATLAEVVDGRLGQHGIDVEKISWDAYRRDDGTWRIIATWASGKATAQAVWELDKPRQQVAPHDDMAHYLCGERPAGVPEPGQALPGRGEPSRGEPTRGGHEPMRPAADTARREPMRPGRGLGAPDPIRAGRDALLASLERPLGKPKETSAEGEAPAAPPAAPEAPPRRARGAAALIGTSISAFDDDPADASDAPTVPSLAVLRPRLKSHPSGPERPASDDKPRKRLPSWDDVLFGSAPARETS
ncbi:hypothetical protein Val02_13230 [Virgisporangium aliadipatigenens]|uniref:DUF3071 domain-containing protein n=1 Tax=Virgisporangium aliadipatigenens TaxID=741659 RepID=A0A8J3YHL8_9ACTN|nr:septation protein SepH [Virgisporangium aliadipatigenens]GIJ44437.1 hypothetical protein Val02_13230 [Virgisporangium aliadipatigenens]